MTSSNAFSSRAFAGDAIYPKKIKWRPGWSIGAAVAEPHAFKQIVCHAKSTKRLGSSASEGMRTPDVGFRECLCLGPERPAAAPPLESHSRPRGAFRAAIDQDEKFSVNRPCAASCGGNNATAPLTSLGSTIKSRMLTLNFKMPN